MTKRIGLIGLDSSHAEDFLRLFNVEERHAGMRVTALWGNDRVRMRELLMLAEGTRPADSLADLVGMVDAVIVGDRHGDLHLAHALPCLEAGLAVFVDKPLACSAADAEAIVMAAERTSTPLLSGSALRWQAETRALKVRLARLDGPVHVAAYGTWYPDSEYGGAIFYAIHTIELVQQLIGPIWSDVAVARGDSPTIRYRSGGSTVALEFRPLGASGSFDFGVSINAPGARIEQPVPLGDDYMAPVAVEIAAMLESGASPISPEQLLAPIALMETIETLLRPGR
jgi:predicted dehydrogenase